MMQSGERLIFQRNISPPYSGPKTKTSKKPAEANCKVNLLPASVVGDHLQWLKKVTENLTQGSLSLG
jgi:hypothetical protein